MNCLSNLYYKILIAGFTFIVLAIPFAASPITFFPLDFGKAAVFRITIEILLFVYVLLILGDRKYLPPKNLITLLVAGFWGILALAAIFSIQPFYSFWGGIDRMDGFLTLSHYFIFFFILTGVLKEKWGWLFVVKSAVLASAFMSLIAIGQKANLPFKFLSWGGIEISNRPPAMLGNPLFFSSYLLLLMFLTLSLIINKSAKKWKLLLGVIFSLQFVALFLADTKAAQIGFAAGILWFIFFFLKKVKILLFHWKTLTATLIFILAIIAAVFSFFPNLKSAVPVPRLLSLIESPGSIGGSLLQRFQMWQIGFEALVKRPVLGYGPENFRYVLDKYYIGELSQYHYYGSTFYHRAMNVIIDLGITAGFFGVLAYLAIFAFIFRGLQKVKKEGGENSILAVGLQATFIAYFVQNLSSFDIVTTYIIFFFLLGFSTFVINARTAAKTYLKIVSQPYFLIPGAVIIIGFLLYLTILPLLANQKIGKIIKISNDKEMGPVAAMSYYQMNYPIILRGSSQIAYENSLISLLSFLSAYGDLSLEKNPNEALKIYLGGLDILKNQNKLKPRDIRILIFLGKFYAKLAAFDKKYLDFADKSFQKASQESSRREQVFHEWGKVNILREDYQLAEENFRKAEILGPLNPQDNWWWLGISYIYNGKAGPAQKYLIKSGGLNDKNNLAYLAKVYAKTKEWEYLASAYKTLIDAEPKNPQWYASLAATYRELGQNKKARETALKILEIKPKAKGEVEDFLQTLP